MSDKACGVCGTPFGDRPLCLAQGHRWGHRRWDKAVLQICEDCHDSRTGYWNLDRKAMPVGWMQLVGRGEQMEPTPCSACAHPVIRNADPLLKRVTCSASCSVSLTRKRNGGRGSGQPCTACGTPVTTGRADSRYCTPACKQKAYRARASHS